MANEINETNVHSQVTFYNWLHFDEHITINKCYQCYIQLYSLIFSNKIQCYICLKTFCKNCANKEITIKYNNDNNSNIEKHIQLCNRCYYNYIEYNKNMINKVNIYNNIQHKNNITNIYQAQYEKKLKEIINDTLITNINKHTAKEYGMILYENIKEIMYNIKPLYSYIDNSNSNIGIQIIKNESKGMISKVINGFVMEKYKGIKIYMNSNNCSKVVNVIINNPRIIIVNHVYKEYDNNKDDVDIKYNDILKSEQQEMRNNYLVILLNKLKLINVNVILIGQTYKNTIINELIKKCINELHEKIYVITNIKQKDIYKLEQCTQTIALPSFDFINSKTIVGNCSQFEIKTIEHAQSIQTYISFTNELEMSYATLCLINPNNNNETIHSQYKQIKQTLEHIIIPLAKDILLHSNYCLYFNASFNDLHILNVNNIKLIANTIYIPITNEHNNNNINNHSIINTDTFLKYIPEVCECSKEQLITFYSNKDESLGTFILNLNKHLHTKCQRCNNQNIFHQYNYYIDNNGKLSIRMIRDITENDLCIAMNYIYKKFKLDFFNKDYWINFNTETQNNNKIITHNNSNQIYTYSYCKKCKCIVTPPLHLTQHMYNYSKYKFIHNMLSNHEHIITNPLHKEKMSMMLLNNNSKQCNHLINKDINRIFITNSSVLLFEYNTLPKYIPFPFMHSSISLNIIETCVQLCIELSERLFSYLSQLSVNIIKQFDEFSIQTTSLCYQKKAYEEIKNDIMKLISFMIGQVNQYKLQIKCNDNISHENSLYLLAQLIRIVQYTDHNINKIFSFLSQICNKQYNKNKFTFITNDNHSYQCLLKLLSYYNINHSLYSHNINKNDIMNIITKALTSKAYKETITTTTNVNDVNLLNITTLNRNHKHQMEFTFTKPEYKYKYNDDTYTNDETISTFLEKEITLTTNNPFTCIINVNNKQQSHSNKLSPLYKSINKIKHKFYLFKQNILLRNNKISNTPKQLPLYEITIYFPKQFEALRIAYCSNYYETIYSLYESKEYINVSGGKSNAKFLLSHDNKFIFKLVKQNELETFIEIAFEYFKYISKYLFHKSPTAFAKILGVYKVKELHYEITHYIILMENLLYGINPNEYKAYDLKGAKLNRYVVNKNENKVLLDCNFIEEYKAEPLIIERSIYNELITALKEDTLLLKTMDIVDYSLMLIITNCVNDNNNNNSSKHKYIKIGLIDYLSKYTLYKQIESLSKRITHNLIQPTIIDPTSYRERFITEMNNHFISISH